MSNAAATQPNPTATREFDIASNSLAWAEELRDTLRGGNVLNPYMVDAFQRAVELVAEMSANLDDVMSRWSPEDVGL